MPRTAQQIMDQARDWAQQWDKGKIPDGWSADEGQFPSGMTLLRSLKTRLRRLSTTGFNQCLFDIPLTSGTATYIFSRQAGTIRRVYLYEISTTYEYPVQRTTQEGLDREFFGWKRVTGERASHYYFIGTKALGIFPIVNNARYHLKILADTQVAEPAVPTDIIAPLYDGSAVLILDSDGLAASALPEIYNDALSAGIAADIAIAAGDWAKVGYFNKLYKEGYEGLLADVMSRQSPDTDSFSLDIKGRSSNRGPLGMYL